MACWRKWGFSSDVAWRCLVPWGRAWLALWWWIRAEPLPSFRRPLIVVRWLRRPLAASLPSVTSQRLILQLHLGENKPTNQLFPARTLRSGVEPSRQWSASYLISFTTGISYDGMLLMVVPPTCIILFHLTIHLNSAKGLLSSKPLRIHLVKDQWFDSSIWTQYPSFTCKM